MGKIKKFKAEFKEQNLLTKFRIIIISILVLISLGWVGKHGFDFVRTKVNHIERHYNVVRKDIITPDYLLLSYEDKSCQLVYAPKEKKLGSRFTSCHISNYLTEDSVLYLYSKNKKGWKTFSLATGNFSEEYFDHIKRPDTLHHYSACSRNGQMGFLNVRSGELAIPLQFREPEHFGRNFNSYYHYRDCVEESDYIMFHGQYCIVPTSSQAYGVIDSKGKLLLNGYSKIAHHEKQNLFETYRVQKEHAFFAAKDMKCLAKGKNIHLTIGGVVNVDDGSLVNYDGDVISDLTKYVDLSKYGYREVDLRGKAIYSEDFYGDITVTYRDPDVNYMYIDSKGEEVCDYEYDIWGVKDRKNGRIVVEPNYRRSVQAYKNANGKYLFRCYLSRYAYEDYEYGEHYIYIDEDGKILFKKDLELI